MRKNNLETKFQLARYPLKDFSNKAVLVAECEHQISSLLIRTILVWGQAFVLISGMSEFAYIYVKPLWTCASFWMVLIWTILDLLGILQGMDEIGLYGKVAFLMSSWMELLVHMVPLEPCTSSAHCMDLKGPNYGLGGGIPWLSDRASALHALGPTFSPQHLHLKGSHISSCEWPFSALESAACLSRLCSP